MFSYSKDTLIKHIKRDKGYLQSYFSNIEKERFIKSTSQSNWDKKLSREILTTHNISIIIPNGFKLAKSSTNFIWIRHSDTKIDNNIIVAHTSYQSKSQFDKENIIKWRDSIAKSHLYGNPENVESYVVTETLESPIFDTIRFNDNYAIKIRGLWRTNNKTMGGPFIGYIFYDDNTNLLYYIEGFCFAPGVKKREVMRKLDSIIKTFRTNSI